MRWVADQKTETQQNRGSRSGWSSELLYLCH
jgi:hypothetical protein